MDSQSQYRGEFGGQSQSHSSPNLQDAQCENMGAPPEVSSEERIHISEESNNAENKKDEEEDFMEDSLPGTKKRKILPRSKYWTHYVKFYCEIDKVQKARCKYCAREIKADSKSQGTGPIINHYNACKAKPPNLESNQTQLVFQTTNEGDKSGHLVKWTFDQSRISEALSNMLIIDELPFATVEKLGFKLFVAVACPNFQIPSRRTITKDVYKTYVDEKAKLKTLIKNHAQRVCVTTDTWTSIQRVNYMCLTSHFIDDRWTLHKRILNFCPISGHKSEEIGKGVEKCLLDWGIEKVFTITVDNASSNDGAIVYLKKKFENWGHNILDGKYVHMRCIAHIINLVVQDGLKGKDEHEAISRIRGAIRYIKNSPARYKRFQECAAFAKVETKKLLCLDVPTRWNSTYLMLESALSLRRAFDEYEDVDLAYTTDLSKKPFCGVPVDYDWKRAKLLIRFLEHFYLLTLRISGSLHITSNIVFDEISEVNILLREWLDSDDFELSEMARKMKEKYDKYWGSLEKMNMVLYYAAVLDPRQKMEFIEFTFHKIYESSEKRNSMKELVENGLFELFNDYKLRYGHTIQETLVSSATSPSFVSSFSSKHSLSDVQGELSRTRKVSLQEEFRMFKSGGRHEHVKSELEKYLGEDIEENGKERFVVLKWWKLNAQRFPILSKMARDVLAVPVSTVASESSFSTGGRVLDAFRSSLTPKIVQALICGSDWLRMNSKQISVEEDLSEVEMLEKELTKLGIDSSIIDI